jgi:Uma2 family endonuclease
MGAFEVDLANSLVEFMRPFARAHRLGRVVSEMLFELPVVNRQRRPDVAFVSYQCWPRNQRVPSAPAWEVVPDLAVEIVSPSNTAEEVLDKMREYFRAGSKVVWVVWSNAEEVYVYTSPTDIRVLTRSDTLEGDPVVPGFRLPLAQLFEEETDPAPPADQSAPPPGSSEQ